MPKFGSGLLTMEYSVWVWEVITDPIFSLSSHPTGWVKDSGVVCISSLSRFTESGDEFTITGELGLGRSLGIRADLPYFILDDLGAGYRGFGDLTNSAKWSFADPQDSSCAGVTAGYIITSGDSSFSPGFNIPWAKLIYRIPIGSHRLIGNIGLRYLSKDKYGNDEADHMPFSLAVQLNGHDVMVVPIELNGDYQFHTLGEPSHVAFQMNLTVKIFVITDHLTVGGGLLFPVIAMGDALVCTHFNSGFLFLKIQLKKLLCSIVKKLDFLECTVLLFYIS